MGTDLLADLEAMARAASTDVDRWIFRAQRTCALARLGRIEAARLEIRDLRALNTSFEPKLTAWILLAEGLCDHFASLSTDAIDQFKRAHGLGCAIGDLEIRSLAAAWIGASEFLMGRHEAAALRAAEAIKHSPTNGHLARSRAHLVLANCLYGFGSESLAARHYAKARSSAVDAHDISMQSAILYNLAAFRLWRLSFEDAFGVPLVADEVHLAALEVESIGNLDKGLQIASLQAMVPLLRAQLRLIGTRWAEADAIYSEFAHGSTRRLTPRYLAEQSHCKAMLCLREQALELAAQAQDLVTEKTELDDRAVCHARLSSSFACFGMNREARAQSEASQKYRTAFLEYQGGLRARLVSIADEAVLQ